MELVSHGRVPWHEAMKPGVTIFDLRKIAYGVFQDSPLRDLAGEKLAIARDFLLPKQIEQQGLKPENINVSDNSLLEIIRRNRAWNDEAARKQLLKFFEAWGPTDPATVKARRKLSSILFR